MASKTHPLIHGLFSFDGRMRRSEYWITSFGLGIFKGVLTLLLGVLTGQIEAKDGGWVSWVVELLFLWPTLAILVKRGHDRNRPALFSIGLMVAALVAIGIVTVAELSGNTTLVIVFGLFMFGCLGFLFIEYGFFDGTQGPNRYGPSPKGIGPRHREQDVATVFE